MYKFMSKLLGLCIKTVHVFPLPASPVHFHPSPSIHTPYRLIPNSLHIFCFCIFPHVAPSVQNILPTSFFLISCPLRLGSAVTSSEERSLTVPRPSEVLLFRFPMDPAARLCRFLTHAVHAVPSSLCASLRQTPRLCCFCKLLSSLTLCLL